MTQTRLRRPVPERTTPKRGVLGAFGQKEWGQNGQIAPEWSAQATGHPLGFGGSETDTPFDFLDDQVREAAQVVDLHIEGEAADQPDTGLLGALSAGYGGLNGADLTALATQLTRTYSDVAAQWVDLAGTLKDYLTRAAAPPAPAAPQAAQHAAPTLNLRTACPVEVRVEMFRPALALTAQPLGSDNPAQPARITDVSVTHNRLCISVPHDQPPGTYYGLLLEDGQGPAGVVTLDVLAEGEA